MKIELYYVFCSSAKYANGYYLVHTNLEKVGKFLSRILLYQPCSSNTQDKGIYLKRRLLF